MGKETKVEKWMWLDMEMTGLDPKEHKIIEVALIVTDLNFNPLTAYEQVIFQPPEELAKMDKWCTQTHSKSGLTQKIPQGMSLETAEKEIIEICKTHFTEKIILCGNTIGQDRKFIENYMPEFEKLLHYRMVDVSSYKEIFKHIYKIKFEKKEVHRATADIEESIAELKFYLSYFKPSAA